MFVAVVITVCAAVTSLTRRDALTTGTTKLVVRTRCTHHQHQQHHHHHHHHHQHYYYSVETCRVFYCVRICIMIYCTIYTRLRHYKAKGVKTRCYQEGVGQFERRFQGEGVVPREYFLVSTKLDTFCYPTVQTAPCYVPSF